MSYACIDWKNTALWWSTAETVIYFIVSKFCLETPVMELLYIKKTPHAWWCKVLRLIQDMVRALSSHGRQGNYIQDLFGPRQTDSGLLSSRGLIQFCHPQDGHEFVSLSFPRTTCQLNTPSSTSSRNLVPQMGRRTNFLPTASSPLPALPTFSTKAQANRWWPQQARTAEPLPPCRTSAPAQAWSPWRAAALLTCLKPVLGFWPHWCRK